LEATSRIQTKIFGGKGKQKNVAMVKQGLGSYSGGEMQVTAVGIQCKSSIYANSSSTTC